MPVMLKFSSRITELKFLLQILIFLRMKNMFFPNPLIRVINEEDYSSFYVHDLAFTGTIFIIYYYIFFCENNIASQYWPTYMFQSSM